MAVYECSNFQFCLNSLNGPMYLKVLEQILRDSEHNNNKHNNYFNNNHIKLHMPKNI